MSNSSDSILISIQVTEEAHTYKLIDESLMRVVKDVLSATLQLLQLKHNIQIGKLISDSAKNDIVIRVEIPESYQDALDHRQEIHDEFVNRMRNLIRWPKDVQIHLDIVRMEKLQYTFLGLYNK